MSWWTPERKAYAVDFLISNGGLSPWGAAGLVSRWANVEAPNGPTSRGGYLGRAWGIAQWLGDRLPPINGNPSFDAQLQYVVQELNSNESRAGNLLRMASDSVSGAQAATAYERASGWNAATNTDNFTNRTANGIGLVLTNWQGAKQAADSSVFPSLSAGVTGLLDAGGGAPVAVEIGLGTVALIGGGLLLLYLATRD